MISFSTALLALVAFIVAFSAYRWSRSRSEHPLPLPPGPPRHWLLGHLLAVPRTKAWLTFRNWCDQYGDLLYLDIPLRPTIIVGSFQAADDLLNRKSHIYSSRMHSVMLNLLGWDWTIVGFPYGQKLRTYRRYFHDHFNIGIVPKYQPVQLEEVRRSLLRLVHAPQDAREHIRHLPGYVIIRCVYGVHNTAKLHKYVKIANDALESTRRIATPGAFKAEFLQFLRHVPAWMPGGEARRYAEKYIPKVKLMRDTAFDEVKASIDDGKATPSIAYELIRELQGDETEMTPDQDALARTVSGNSVAGGADTIIASTEAFCVAMAMFPEVQRKAQAELDRVVGHSRLPEFSDLQSLVYVRAVILEALRWMPAVPLGIPHYLTEDDEYNGYFLPKGSTVVYNLRAMMHNPEDFPDPEQFKPERFIGKDGQIDPNVRDPMLIAFGFGRRICPGMDFAMGVVSMYICSMLHVFEILPGVDEEGDEVILTDEFNDGAAMAPVTFPQHFTPRSDVLESLVLETVPPEDEDISC